MIEETVQGLLLRRLHLRAGKRRLRLAGQARLHPFIRHQQHRLGDVERRKGRVDGKSDDLVGQRHFLVRQSEFLATEQDASPLAGAKTRSQDARGLHWRTNRLEPVPCPGRGGVDEAEIGNRILGGGMNRGALDDMVGPACRRPCLFARPSVARVDQAQLRQAEIGHRAGHHADIFAKLRLDQDDGRPLGDQRPVAIVVGHSPGPRFWI